jgi:4-amino-4-deoxy-L-arabinose transferase-like glycosyltransferase
MAEFAQCRRGTLARRGLVVLGGLFLFAYGFCSNVVHGRVSWDQNWFLLVAQRLLSGDILYRDVWFVATPLSIYLTSGLAAVFGVEILVIKALMSLCFAGTCLLTYGVARQLGLSRFASAVLVLLLLIYYPSWLPGYNVPYTPLGYFFMLAALGAVLRWRKELLKAGASEHRGALYALILAGSCAGLSFASKQNLGVYTLVALFVSVVAVGRTTGVGSRSLLCLVIVPLAAACIAVGLVLLPVWHSGAMAKLLDYGFFDQGTYVTHADISYTQQISRLPFLAREVLGLRHVGAFLEQLQFALPIPAFAALVWSLVRSRSDGLGLSVAVSAFVAASFVGVFPRVDPDHMICAVPALLLGLAWAWPRVHLRVNSHWDLALRLAVLLSLGAWACYGSVGNVRWLRNSLQTGTYRFAPWPRYRGVLLRADFIDQANKQAEIMKASATGEEVFILTPPAAFYYHITGLRNPTPFDFPLSTAFGLHGQKEVIELLEKGQICQVCISPLGTHDFAPALLEAYVLDHLEPMDILAWCEMYHNPRCPP